MLKWVRNKFRHYKLNTHSVCAIVDDLLQSQNEIFIAAIKAMVQEGPPNANTMRIIALANLDTILTACYNINKSDTRSNLPNNLSELILYFARESATAKDEINKRRLLWFCQAGMIRRASNMANNNKSYTEDVSLVWVELIKSGAHLNNAVTHNALWKEEEKVWFSDIDDEYDGMKYVYQFMTPQSIKDTTTINVFVDEICL